MIHNVYPLIHLDQYLKVSTYRLIKDLSLDTRPVMLVFGSCLRLFFSWISWDGCKCKLPNNNIGGGLPYGPLVTLWSMGGKSGLHLQLLEIFIKLCLRIKGCYRRLADFPYVFIIYIFCILLEIYVMYKSTSVFRFSCTYASFKVLFLVNISYSWVLFWDFMYTLLHFVCIYDGGDFSSLLLLSYVIISPASLLGFILRTIKIQF